MKINQVLWPDFSLAANGGISGLRLDKFLKNSRLIKRRTIAKEACDRGRILLNGRTAKAGSEVKPGDTVEISFGEKKVKVRIVSTMEHASREQAKDMYIITE